MRRGQRGCSSVGGEATSLRRGHRQDHNCRLGDSWGALFCGLYLPTQSRGLYLPTQLLGLYLPTQPLGLLQSRNGEAVFLTPRSAQPLLKSELAASPLSILLPVFSILGVFALGAMLCLELGVLLVHT